MSEAYPPIVIEQDFPVSAATLWQAITDHSRMLKWFFADIPDFKPEVGFETEFKIHCNGRDFIHLWRITAVEPGRSITYHWAYRDIPGAAEVRFEVSGDEASSRLRVTNSQIEPFPSDIPEFSREACESGWRYFVQGSLKEHLADGADHGFKSEA